MTGDLPKPDQGAAQQAYEAAARLYEQAAAELAQAAAHCRVAATHSEGTVASGPKVRLAGSNVEPLPIQTAARSAQSKQS